MKKGLFVVIAFLNTVHAFSMERPKRSLQLDVEMASKKPKAYQQAPSAEKVESISPDWYRKLANFDALPVNIKYLILEQIIAKTKDLEEAIQEIKKIRLISKASNAFISSPQTLQWLVSKLAFDFGHFNYETKKYITEQSVFDKLKPLTDTAEMKTWFQNQQPFIEWKNKFLNVMLNRDLAQLKQLLEENKTTFKKDLNEISIRGVTPLILASQREWLDGVQALLDDGADPNLANPNRYELRGSLPLMAPSSYVDSVEHVVSQKPIIALLLKSGADINKQGADGRSHLLSVVESLFFQALYDEDDEYSEFYDYIKYLLESGANPNIPNKQGMTPLSIVLLYNFRRPELRVAKLVKLLMDFGADPNRRLSVSPRDIYNLDDDDAEYLTKYLSEDEIEEYFAIRGNS